MCNEQACAPPKHLFYLSAQGKENNFGLFNRPVIFKVDKKPVAMQLSLVLKIQVRISEKEFKMTSAVRKEARLYENYRPVQDDNPQIGALQQRVNSLMQRLRKEEGALSSRDALTISDLKDELDFTIKQRDTLLDRVRVLMGTLRLANEAVQDSDECLRRCNERHRNVTVGGGIGFGASAAGALLFGLNSLWTVVSIAAGTVFGMIVGEATSKDKNKKD